MAARAGCGLWIRLRFAQRPIALKQLLGEIRAASGQVFQVQPLMEPLVSPAVCRKRIEDFVRRRNPVSCLSRVVEAATSGVPQPVVDRHAFDERKVLRCNSTQQVHQRAFRPFSLGKSSRCCESNIVRWTSCNAMKLSGTGHWHILQRASSFVEASMPAVAQSVLLTDYGAPLRVFRLPKRTARDDAGCESEASKADFSA